MIQAAFKPVKSLKAQVRQPFVRQPFDDSIFSFSESLNCKVPILTNITLKKTLEN